MACSGPVTEAWCRAAQPIHRGLSASLPFAVKRALRGDFGRFSGALGPAHQ